MDITLATNTDNPTLQFRNVGRFSDGSGYRTELFVRSRGFGVELPFYFEAEPFREFIGSLDRMDKALNGKAVLKPMFEDHFIEVEMGGAGHVHGEFREEFRGHEFRGHNT